VRARELPNITHVGQRLIFSVNNVPQGPFGVDIVRFDPGSYTITGATVPGDLINGHPLLGWRYWKVYANGAGLTVETGSLDRPAVEWDPYLQGYRWIGFYVDKWWLGQQLQMWKEMLLDVLNGLNNDPVGGGPPIGGVQKLRHEGSPSRLDGRWEWMDKEYIRKNICGPLPSTVAPICR